jgi:hypothetical protein
MGREGIMIGYKIAGYIKVPFKCEVLIAQISN